MNKKQYYPGAKNGSGIYQNIINLIPPHTIYIEPFYGSGAILKKKKLSQFSILIDLNAKCIDAGRQLNLSGCTFINTDGISFIENFLCAADILLSYNARSFLYLDPPYPLETRRSQNKLYKYEFNTMDHTRLLNVIRSTNIPIMISSYKNDLYDTLLKNWNRFDFPAVTRKSKVTESIYINYDKPKILHDYSYIGNNFREREKLKGIIFRNVSKFNKMPQTLKNAIFTHIHSNEKP